MLLLLFSLYFILFYFILGVLGMFQQHYLERFYEAWERFKDFIRATFYLCIQDEQLQLIFFYGLNEDTRRWVDDGSMASGCPFLSRNGDDAYFLLEDMASYYYH